MSSINLNHTLTAADLKEIDDLATAKKMSREKAAAQIWELTRRLPASKASGSGNPVKSKG